MGRTRRASIAGITAVVLLGGGGGGQAQQPDSARLPLPPIIVDALRVGVPLGRLPLTAFELDSTRTLRAGSGTALDAPLRGIPGLQLDDRHNQALGERLSIRGFGARASFGIRGVHVRVDDIPATMPDGQTTLNHVDPAAIARAQVVRGPAAAFLGNAAGGALLLHTGTSPGASMELQAGEAGQRLYALSAAEAGAEREWHVRASLQEPSAWRPWSGAERWLLNAGGRMPLGAARLRLALHATRYDAENPGALTAEQLAADPRQAFANNVRQRTGEEGTHVQAGASYVRPLGGQELLLRAHGGVRSVDNPIPPAIIEVERRFGGVGVQLRRARGTFVFGAGADAAAQWDERSNWVNEEGVHGALTLAQRERVLVGALHASGAWLAPAGFDLLAAARYDHHAFRVRDAFLGDDPDDSGTRTMSAASGVVGIGWRAGAALRLHANAGTSFQTPTTTELANRPDGAGGFNPNLEPEHTRSLEAGVRGLLGPVGYEVTAFSAHVRDRLVPFEVESAPGRQYFRNAGTTRHRGVELALDTRVADRVSLWGSYTRLDARFTGATNALVGRRVPGVAGHLAEAGASVHPGRGWSLHAWLRNVGRVAADDANAASSPAHTRVGARLDGAFVRQRFALEPYVGVDNLFAEQYVAAVTVNAFGGRYYEPGPPRSLYGGFRLRWR